MSDNEDAALVERVTTAVAQAEHDYFSSIHSDDAMDRHKDIARAALAALREAGYVVVDLRHVERLPERLLSIESWQIEDRREAMQPGLLGNVAESVDRAFVAGGRAVLWALRNPLL